ncbi:hypothetical protein P5V15_007098 [Pogonomyrmex californicus]
MNLDFEHNKFAVLYDMYLKFRKTYYECETCEPFMIITRFLQYGSAMPFVVIGSRQNESIKSVTVDVRVEFEYKENVRLTQWLIVSSFTID